MEVRATERGSLVEVRVRPRSRPAIALRDGGLVVSVAAPAVDGRATEEARRALAAALGVAPTSVVLRSGARSSRKTFVVDGIAPEEVSRRLSVACR